MYCIFLQIFYYLHQAVFIASCLVLCGFILYKLQPRREVTDIYNRYILITGCDSGFGREAAARLDQMGFRVFATCLTKEGAQSLNQSCSKRLVAFKMDVTQRKDVQEAFHVVKSHLPQGYGKSLHD